MKIYGSRFDKLTLDTDRLIYKSDNPIKLLYIYISSNNSDVEIHINSNSFEKTFAFTFKELYELGFGNGQVVRLNPTIMVYDDQDTIYTMFADYSVSGGIIFDDISISLIKPNVNYNPTYSFEIMVEEIDKKPIINPIRPRPIRIEENIEVVRFNE